MGLRPVFEPAAPSTVVNVDYSGSAARDAEQEALSNTKVSKTLNNANA